MPNKHAAGCQCCAGGDCSPCTKTISNVSVTYGEETVSWAVNKAINAIPGCTLVLRYCGTPTVYDLLDYSIDEAWDGRIGDCWKAFSPPQYPFTTTGSACWCVESPPPPGGGGGGPGGGPGGPVTPGTCTLCSTWAAMYRLAPPSQIGLVSPCDVQRYHIVTQAVNDVHVRLKLKVWDEVEVNLQFLGGSPDQVFSAGVTVHRKTEVQSFLKYEVVNYYNTYCPKDVDCNTAPAVTCDPDDPNFDPLDPGTSSYEGWAAWWCEFGQQFAPVNGVDPLDMTTSAQNRYLGCDDTPVWVELTTSKYCFDPHCDECNWDIETCAAGDNDIPNWKAQTPGDPLCYFIHQDPDAVPSRNLPDDFSDWPQYNQDGPRSPMSATCDAKIGDDVINWKPANVEVPCLPIAPECFGHKCGSFVDYTKSYGATITIACNSLCASHTLNAAGGDVAEDITMEFTRCVFSQCSEGIDAPDPICQSGVSELWLDECCLDSGPAPSTVAIPLSSGWPGSTITLTIACAP